MKTTTLTLKDLCRVNIWPHVGQTFRIEHFTVEKDSIERIRLAMQGRGIEPGTYTRLYVNNCLMMSDTPAEIDDLHGFVLRANGNVLVTGLGLGVILRPLLDREWRAGYFYRPLPPVESVTVVEVNPELAAYVGGHYMKQPWAEGRLSIVTADAFTWTKPKATKFDSAWHDIWPTICGDNLPEMTKLRRRYRTKTTECWAQELCRRG